MTIQFTTSARALAAAGALSAGLIASAGAVTLYDPAAGAPGAPDWTNLKGGTAATNASVSAGVYHLDTTANVDTVFSSVRAGVPGLDTSNGFTLGFSLKLLSESHVTNDRAGFSVIVTGADPKQALELGFWNDGVWAYTFTSGAFGHGAQAMFTTTLKQDYALTVQNNAYVLTGSGATLLTGSLVDYSARGIVYAIPSLIAFGDDTSRASASVELGAITLSPVPEPASAALLGGGLLLLAARRARRG